MWQVSLGTGHATLIIPGFWVLYGCYVKGVFFWGDGTRSWWLNGCTAHLNTGLIRWGWSLISSSNGSHWKDGQTSPKKPFTSIARSVFASCSYSSLSPFLIHFGRRRTEILLISSEDGGKKKKSLTLGTHGERAFRAVSGGCNSLQMRWWSRTIKTKINK